jgi:peptidoglycan/xylan/chitin deacetylase (PgdA/CDA1 family)
MFRQMARVEMSRQDRAAAVLDAAPLRALLARLPLWNGVLVLNYHRVGDPAGTPWDHQLYSATAEGFDAQLAFLAREADVVGPQDLAELARAGRGRHVLLTFDDGYRDNYEIAFPLLRARGLSATFFLASGFLDRTLPAWWDEIAWMVHHATDDVGPGAALTARYKQLQGDQTEAFLDDVAQRSGAGRCPPEAARDTWMTWEMARELRDAGMPIGGHTETHPLLARIPEEQQEREIATCARRLSEELDLPMRWFSYPVGSPDAFTPATREILARHGVELAFSFYGGIGRYSAWDPLDVRRMNVGPAIDAPRVQAMLRLPQLFARVD